MDRKLASIQRIIDIQPIEGADRIECASVLGWRCVVGKGEFKVGDPVVYLEVDAITPATETYKVLETCGYRVKTRKFKKQISQGLCLPLSILPIQESPLKWVGDDVTELLGITKYEPYIPAQLAGKVKGNFPEFIHKTDEIRCQAIPEIIERYKGNTVVVCEKLDGTSCSLYWNNNIFGVCSRNLELTEDENNTYWKVARELNLKEKLEKLGKNIGIAGELVGVGIQKNKYSLPNVQLKVFNIFDIDKGQYLEYDDMVTLANDLQIDLVPFIDKIKLEHSVEQLIEMAKGFSQLNSKTLREGLVLRVTPNVYDPDLHGRASWKAINPEFLLKYEE